MGLQPLAGGVPGLLDLRRGGAQVVGAVVLGHPGEERLHPGLERVVLVDVVGVPDALRVDGAVQHHAAHPVREQRRVHLADVGAVGEGVIADLLLAERRPDGVDVPGHVFGRHVGQQPAEPLLAVGRVRLGPVDQDLLGGRVGRDVVGPDPGEKVRLAGQGGHGGADAARVEADDVVLGGHGRADALRHRRRQGPAAGARAARVDQQVALLLAGRGRRRDLRQGQRDLPPAGVGVVHRDPQVRALHRDALHPADRAGTPVQR